MTKFIPTWCPAPTAFCLDSFIAPDYIEKVKMADEPKGVTEPPPPDGKVVPALIPPPLTLPAAIKDALSKVPDTDARSMLSMAISRTSFGFGPDAETMKIMAETEVHEESCRLDAFKSSLANRDKQAERDHDFRKIRLNHQTAMTVLVLLVGAGLIGFGIYIHTTSQNQLGGYLIVGGAALLFQAMGLKPPSSPKD